MDAKRIAGEKAAEYVQDGMIVGLGTGSTAYWAIQKLGQRVKEGLNIQVVSSSLKSEALAKELQIPVASFANIKSIDVAIDGADEIDAAGNLVKGGGGALLREKILAFNSKRFCVIVDETKLVTDLGKFPLPVEITIFAAELTLQHLSALGGAPVLRQLNHQNFVTDNGNWIADCHFYPIHDPDHLSSQLKSIPGVVETGLFMHTMISTIIIGYKDGRVEERLLTKK